MLFIGLPGNPGGPLPETGFVNNRFYNNVNQPGDRAASVFSSPLPMPNAQQSMQPTNEEQVLHQTRADSAPFPVYMTQSNPASAVPLSASLSQYQHQRQHQHQYQQYGDLPPNDMNNQESFLQPVEPQQTGPSMQALGRDAAHFNSLDSNGPQPLLQRMPFDTVGNNQKLQEDCNITGAQQSHLMLKYARLTQMFRQSIERLQAEQQRRKLVEQNLRRLQNISKEILPTNETLPRPQLAHSATDHAQEFLEYENKILALEHKNEQLRIENKSLSSNSIMKDSRSLCRVVKRYVRDGYISSFTENDPLLKCVERVERVLATGKGASFPSGTSTSSPPVNVEPLSDVCDAPKGNASEDAIYISNSARQSKVRPALEEETDRRQGPKKRACSEPSKDCLIYPALKKRREGASETGSDTHESPSKTRGVSCHVEQNNKKAPQSEQSITMSVHSVAQNAIVPSASPETRMKATEVGQHAKVEGLEIQHDNSDSERVHKFCAELSGPDSEETHV